MRNKIFVIVLCLFVEASASACTRVMAISYNFDEGSAALKAVDREKLTNWLEKSLRIFPFGIMLIESHAYANTKEKAQELAKSRSEYIKENMFQQLPADTLFEIHDYGHTTRKAPWLESSDIVFINWYPDLEKLKLPPCQSIPSQDAIQDAIKR